MAELVADLDEDIPELHLLQMQFLLMSKASHIEDVFLLLFQLPC
jgi:hypothetical protein